MVIRNLTQNRKKQVQFDVVFEGGGYTSGWRIIDGKIMAPAVRLPGGAFKPQVQLVTEEDGIALADKLYSLGQKLSEDCYQHLIRKENRSAEKGNGEYRPRAQQVEPEERSPWREVGDIPPKSKRLEEMKAKLADLKAQYKASQDIAKTLMDENRLQDSINQSWESTRIQDEIEKVEELLRGLGVEV